ncbi:NADH-quinone oxidoreductase subunit N [Maioricimonas sp. JC845]|uniref:NADH-quinone oxidoreductase subunit N n=1 Tax=Maioricimonas sp. JC845 TaxID=3232138 RepID=UPI0034591955
MSVTEILNALLSEDLPRSLEIFTPELIVCVSIVALLLTRLIGLDRRLSPCWVALVGSLVAFTAAFAQFMYIKTGPVDGGLLASLYENFRLSATGVGTPGPYFTGLLMHDPFTLFFRLGLLLFLVLMVALTILSGIPDNEDGPDFYTLLFGATLGMMMATSANHLLMLFLGVEMMSVPSYAMVAFLKGRQQSSEAALKYVVFGAGAAGVMLYGVSLLAGLMGTADLPELGARLTYLVGSEGFSVTSPTVLTTVVAIMMILVGLAFKLSLVPFHFWCPDAFEGAAAEVGGFLSVASKAAAFALLVRFVLAFDGSAEVQHQLMLFLGLGLGVVAAVSTTFGNLAAYSQTNVKRLLAYSTIAHAGYMLMAVSAMLVLLGQPDGGPFTAAEIREEATRSVEGLTYYLVVYLFMNLAAFAIVALIRNEIFSEEIEDYNGLVQCNPATKVLCICMACACFSLVGIPPFGGFFAKLLIFLAVFKAGYVHWMMWVILGIAAINTVFSLFYYLRVLKAMFIEPQAETARPVRTPALVSAYVALITLPILALGASPLQNDLSMTASYVASVLFR